MAETTGELFRMICVLHYDYGDGYILYITVITHHLLNIGEFYYM